MRLTNRSMRCTRLRRAVRMAVGLIVMNWSSLEDRVLAPSESACSEVAGHRSRVHLGTDSAECQIPALLSSARNSSGPVGISDEGTEHGKVFGLVVLNNHPERRRDLRSPFAEH